MRLLALPAALALVAASSVDPLAEIAAANGHAAAVHFRATGEHVVDGRRERVTVEALGVRRMLRRCIADACAGWWFDGRRLATFGLNGVTIPQEDDELTPARRTIAAIVSYAFAEPAFRAGGGVAERVGQHAWRVRAVDGSALIAEFDAHTSVLARIITPDGAPVSTFSRTVRAGDASFARERSGFDEESLESVETLPGPLDAPDDVLATFSGSEAAPLASESIPIVECSIAGRPVRCLLDTGATPSAIALPLVESLGLEPRGEIEITGFSRFATGFVTAGPLVLGSAHFASARFAVIPSVNGAHFDVVIGADLLYRLGLAVDRAHGVVRVTRPVEPGGPAPPALTFIGGVPHIDAELGGERSHALLDTGDASIVSLGYADYRRGPQWPLADRSFASGVGGATDAFAVTVPDVRFGNETLGPTHVEVGRTQDQVHVGIGIWTRCVVELDESLGRFGCAPGAAPAR